MAIRPLQLSSPYPHVQKKILSDAFPGWNIIHTDRGAWWGTRAPLVREDLEPNDVDTVEAPTAGALYEKLAEITQPAES